MSIRDIGKKIKSVWTERVMTQVGSSLGRLKAGLDIKEDLFTVSVIILIGLAGFGLGRLSALEKGREAVRLEAPDFLPAASSSQSISETDTASVSAASAAGLLVASKSGTRYYYPWCSGADRISDKNKVWFQTVEEARAMGLLPASNCPNLK